MLLAAALLAGALPVWAKKPTDPDDLFNPLLGVDYSHWLVGPIARIASEKEIEAYLALTSDEAAARFIAGFWEKRNAGTALFHKTPQQIFDQRVSEADKRFTEGAFPGSRTDRGTIYILYGEPEKIEFQTADRRRAPPIEEWRYAKDAEPGLDGEKPDRLYRFVEVNGHTTFYRHVRLRPDLEPPPPF